MSEHKALSDKELSSKLDEAAEIFEAWVRQSQWAQDMVSGLGGVGGDWRKNRMRAAFQAGFVYAKYDHLPWAYPSYPEKI